MTVSSTTVPRVQYSGNGSTTEFPITFPFAEEDHVIVLLVAADGTESTPAYSIVGASVVCTTAPASGSTLAIYRQTPVTQEIDLVNHDSYDADVYEQALDLAVYRDQEIKSSVVQVDPLTPPEVDVVLPLPSAGAYLRWNDDATGLESVAQLDASTIAISAYMENLLDSIDAADARGALGITDPSAFAATLLDDADAATARTTLGISVYPAKHVHGLLISNNSGDANNDIDMSAGGCRDDSNTYDCTLSASMTKQLDAAWSAGNAQGGLFSGSKAVSTAYHVFLIRNDTSGAIDFGFDSSASGANKPVGWSVMRRRGWVVTDASGNIIAFKLTREGEMWFNARQAVQTGLTAGTYTLVSTAPLVPLLGLDIIESILFGGFSSTATATTVMLSDDGTNAKCVFYAAASSPAIGAANELYSYTNAVPVFIPVNAGGIYYKELDGGTLTLLVRAVRFKC